MGKRGEVGPTRTEDLGQLTRGEWTETSLFSVVVGCGLKVERNQVNIDNKIIFLFSFFSPPKAINHILFYFII